MRFRVWGIRFEVSFYFFALLAAFFILEPDNITACGAIAAILHECGHLAAMLLVPGGHVERVSIGACGVRMTARLRGQFEGWIPVCIAGAAVNLFLAALFMPIAMVTKSHFLSVFASANICLGAVNLLPVEPLDGGQLLRAVMLRCVRPETADNICFALSVITLIPVICAGLWLLMGTRFNFSLLILGMWLLGGVLEEYIR